MATTELSYNGIDFVSLYRTDLRCKPLQDEAKRTTIANEYTLTVSGFIASRAGNVEDEEAGVFADDTVESVRKSLTAQGGALVVNSHGFGFDFAVNGDSEVKDVAWGPRCESISLRPLGGHGEALQVTWVCVFTIVDCDEARHEFAIMSLNYTVEHSRTGDGLQVVRTQGHILIPMTRVEQDNRELPDSVDAADSYREKLEARVVPIGFRRDSQSYLVSMDRRRLDWSWTDTQLPAALPKDVTKIEFRETLKSRGMLMGKMWDLSFSATITLALGVPKDKALTVFLSLVGPKLKAKANFLLEGVEIETNDFALESRFTLRGWMTVALKLQDAVKACGLFEVAAGTDYTAWRQSMYAARVNTVRGNPAMSYEAREDFIVDLCAGGEKEVPAGKDTPPMRVDRGPLRVLPGNPGGGDPSEPKKQPPANSWLDYQCWLRWIERANVSVHKPLPAQPVEPTKIPGAGNAGNRRLPLDDSNTPSGEGAPSVPSLRPFPESKPQSVAPFATGTAKEADADVAPGAAEGRSPLFAPDLVQKAASASRRAQLVGYGIRAGYQVPVPKLVSIGGVNVIEAHRDVKIGTWGVFGDVVVHATYWRITYIVPDAPEGAFPVPANPLIDYDSGAK